MRSLTSRGLSGTAERIVHDSLCAVGPRTHRTVRQLHPNAASAKTRRATAGAGCVAALIVALVAGVAAAAPAPTTSAGPAAKAAPGKTAATSTAAATPTNPHDALLAESAGGKLTDSLIAHFKDYAAGLAKEKLVPSAVSEEFWTWLAANHDLRDPLILATYPAFEPGPFKSLEALRTKFGGQVKDYANLALAMAIVYGRAGTASMRDPFVNFTDKDRPPPSLEDSFAWYLKNERAMRLPLKTTPVALLFFVADNDLPLAERNWALLQYSNLQPAGFAKIYYEVPYDDTRINGPGLIGDRPVTLANILTYGGTCMHRAYYASRVLKSFGVPAVYDRGEGERGGHAWVAWLGAERQQVALLYSGRFDYDHYYTGVIYNPNTRKVILDRDLELDAVAVARSVPAYQDALAASHLFMMADPAEASVRTGLLDGAVRRNPYCDTPWLLVAWCCANGYIPQAQGEKMYDVMLKNFTTYPDLTFRVLEQILSPRLKTSTPPAAEVTANLQLLDRAFQVYDAAKRPDLAVKLRGLQGKYLEAVGRREDALKLYATVSEKYAGLHYGFLDLFDRAVKIMQEDKRQDMLMKYLAAMLAAVPEYQEDFNRKNNLQNTAWLHVIRSYAQVLRDAGKTAEAKALEARIYVKKTTN
jgi:hypothetical protein